MPRSARRVAPAAMNGCVIPAPAPCASTQQARGRGGDWSRAETRMSPWVMRRGCGAGGGMFGLLYQQAEAAAAATITHRIFGRPLSGGPPMGRPWVQAKGNLMSTNDTYLAVFLGSKTSARMKAWMALPDAEKRAKEHAGI